MPVSVPERSVRDVVPAARLADYDSAQVFVVPPVVSVVLTFVYQRILLLVAECGSDPWLCPR